MKPRDAWRLARRSSAPVLILFSAAGCSTSPDVVAESPELLDLSGDLSVHDPAALEVAGGFYIFSTGAGLDVKTSLDLRHWQDRGALFEALPSWVNERVPEARNLWSPTLGELAGRVHLYYAASTYGSRISCIGHAISERALPRLSDAQSTVASPAAVSPAAAGATSEEPFPEQPVAERLVFEDQGPVICSDTSSAYNAIDPSFSVDASGAAWLAFGSFASGIQLIALDGSGSYRDTGMITLAQRPEADNALQQPLITRHDGYYYLFTSFDLDENHELRVGRSPSMTGPYLDRSGRSLLDGGGTPLLATGDSRFVGPGSNTLVTQAGRTFQLYHAYDTQQSNRSTLRAAEILWDPQGWPVSAGP